ncbi:hypothetical protein [Clostridium acidisoli]|nr:hypothetical protein [Clostridium acidisoli]
MKDCQSGKIKELTVMPSILPSSRRLSLIFTSQSLAITINTTQV